MKGKTVFVLFALALILGGGVTQVPAGNVEGTEGAKFDIALSLADNVKNYMGKEVIVHLKSGTTLQGSVKAVGDSFVHLEKLADRDFYDGLIRIDEIAALETRCREME